MKYSKMKETIKELFLKISNNIKIEGKNIRIKVYIIILILALVSIVFNITKPMSKKELINQLEMALLKGKENWVERNIKIDGAKAENDELKPLIHYYLLNNKDVEQVISNLKKNNNSGNLTIESEKSLLGENYYLNLSTISINITSDIKEAIIYINGREVNKEELVSLIPGTYEVAYKLKTDYGDVEETKEMDILSSGDVKIEVAAEYITLYSNFSDAKVYINEKELEEPYLQEGIVTDVTGVGFDDFVVPENCVFAMGDNRNHSTDCRSFGCIPLEEIESTVAIRIWPLDKWGKVE